MNIFNFFVEYWAHILIGALFVVGVVLFIINQRKNVREWLLYAVAKSEKALGAKMGEMKLRQVYDWFISAFPILSKLMTFNAFHKLVKFALVKMAEMIKDNKKIGEYISGE